MKISIGKQTGTGYNAMFFFVVAYRVFLDVIYSQYICPFFGYTGFKYNYDAGLLILSYLLLFLCFPTIKRCTVKGNFSNVIVLFLIYLSYIPFTTMLAFYGYTTSFIIAGTVYWTVMFITCRFMPEINGYFKLKTQNNELILLIIELVFALVIIYVSWIYTGFRFTISLTDVYTFRAESKLAAMPTIIDYIFSASKVALPVLMVYALSRKNYINVVFIVIIQILSFSINGSKTVLFSTLLSIVFYFIYNPSYLKRIPLLMTGFSLISYLETSVLGSIFVLAFLLRRVLFLPNMLCAYYFDFFTQNEPDFYRQSFLRLFGFKSPYSDISHIIGTFYFNKSQMGANNGLISDAITNLGIPGIVIMPIILILVLRFLDKCAYGIDKKLYIITSVIFSFIIISSFLPTVLLTHGLLFLGIVLLLIPRKDEPQEQIEGTNRGLLK